MRPASALGVMALGMVWSGCSGSPGGARGKPGGDDTSTTPIPSPLSTSVSTQTSNSNGIVLVEVEVDADTRSFQVTGEVDTQYRVSLEEIIDPNGDTVLYWDDWWDSAESLTWSIFGFDPTTAISWPIRDVDGRLSEGTYKLRLGITDPDYYYIPNESARVTVQTKSDPSLDEGVVGVQIVWADGVQDLPEVVSGVEDAVERWRSIWASYGLELREEYVTSDLPDDLSFTYQGSDDVAELDKPEGYLRLIVGEQIRNENSTYGISAGIPGTIQDTRNTYVVLSWLVHAGRDATFDEGETTLMGETMAHETGHYMGLFHPVEDGYKAWDALEDTVRCTRARDCEDELGSNLMFPYSICDYYGDGGCVEAEDMTPQQVVVKQQYIGAL